MRLFISGRVLICLERTNKHSKLHQGIDYIALILIEKCKRCYIFFLCPRILKKYFCLLGSSKVSSYSLHAI